MIEKIRNKLLAFIESDKDTPLLAGFSVGFYMILFYYSKNFALANSFEQFLFFLSFYMILPILALFAGYKILGLLKLEVYRKHFLFIGTIGFLVFFLLQMNTIGYSKKIAFGSILIIVSVLSIWLKRYYKLIVLLLFLMSLFNVKPILSVGWKMISSSHEWKNQPDDIENVLFKIKPNIYYIQPDGYTSFKNLRENENYSIDNSDYITFLKKNGFSLYDDYRSNYPSTLLSNSATFSMKHHYIEKDVNTYAARGIIVGDNPVLRVFKNNGYKTSFITENPYLLINRAKLGYDYTNIRHDELPYLKDGFSIKRDVAGDLKNQIISNSKTGNFYFVEKFTPGHIHVYKSDALGKEQERKLYLEGINNANIWLKDIINYIEINDPNAIVIIGADHGGFVGFDYTLESYKKTDHPDLIKSIFGAQLSIKWNSTATEYDKKLTTGVNLFRTIFSFLAEDKRYLDNLEENSSYIPLQEPFGNYRYIDDNGNVVFEKL